MSDGPATKGENMISISRDDGPVTLINAFGCAQQHSMLWSMLGATQRQSWERSWASCRLRSLDGTRVIKYGQLRSADDWENLRRIGRMKAHFEGINRLGRADAHLYAVTYTRERSGTAI
jgi:hypothetical protein